MRLRVDSVLAAGVLSAMLLTRVRAPPGTAPLMDPVTCTYEHACPCVYLACVSLRAFVARGAAVRRVEVSRRGVAAGNG